MRKKIVTIALFVLIFVGSFINFYTTNFVLSDVSNLTFGFGNRPYYIFASLPGLNLSFIIVLATIFLIRTLRHNEYLKRMLRLYTIIGMAFSFIGLVSAILAGILVYKSFVTQNPFPGYLIVSIILFSLIILGGIYFFACIYKKLPDDQEKREMKAGYVFYTIVLSITTFYAFNRFGAFLWMPSYVDLPTLYMTWPFYISLLLPIAMWIHTILYAYKFYKKHNLAALVTIVVITLLFVASVLYIVLLGTRNTQFISVISPAMGASRLLAKPIDILLHFVIFGILDIYALQHSIKYYLKHRKK